MVSRVSLRLFLGTLVVTVALPAYAFQPIAPALEIHRPELRSIEPGSRLEPKTKAGSGLMLFYGIPENDRLDRIGRTVVSADKGFFKVEPSSLALRDLRTFLDRMTYVTYAQTYQGLEVADTHVTLLFKDGRLVLADATTFDDISISTDAAITPADAEALAYDSLAVAGVTGLTVEKAAEKIVWPAERGHRLAYRTTIRSAHPVGRWLTTIAADGSNVILERKNLVAYDAAQILVEVEPRTVGDAPVALPSFGHNITTGVRTDADGIFESAAGQVTLSTTGAYFRVNNQAANERTKQVTVQGGSFETFTWTMAEGVADELDTFYHANKIRAHMLTLTPDLAWLNTTLPVNVNVSGTCNAFYDGGSINFFPTGGGCNSTARISDVVYHEYGHGLHDNLVGGGQMNSQIQEGVADYFAHALTEDPNLGPYFFTGNVQGIRNAEEVRTYPTGVQGNNSQVHESGKIWTNTWWNLRKLMVTKHGAQLGKKYTDLLHANVLRGNPGYTNMYMQVLAVDDDDANLANGTPNSCEITSEFQAHGLVGTAQPTRGFLALTHQPPAPSGFYTQPETPVAVSVDVASKSPSCGGLAAGSVTLHYRVDGGAVQTVALTGTGTSFSGELPGQKDGSVVEYWFSAKEDKFQVEFTAPLFAPANVYRYYVGPLTTVMKDDFETDNGWTHGGSLASQDDWERGTPKGLGFDPAAAFSGSNVWGNDIGVRGGNGLYEAGMTNWLESPSIDCTKCEGARLQFRRWLSVDGADKARVKVNGTVVWESEASPRLDMQWAFIDIPISTEADGQADVKIRFELESNGSFHLSGWAIDDVAVMAVEGGTDPGEPPPGPGGAVGNALDGGCTCTVASSGTPDAGWALTMLAGLAGMVAIRRRRA